MGMKGLDNGDGKEGVKQCLPPRLDDIVVHDPNNEVNFHTKN